MKSMSTSLIALALAFSVGTLAAETKKAEVKKTEAAAPAKAEAAKTTTASNVAATNKAGAAPVKAEAKADAKSEAKTDAKPAAEAAVSTHEGLITKIDAAAKTVTISNSKGAFSFIAKGDVELKVGAGAEARSKFADLKVGDKISVVYTTVGKDMVMSKVVVTKK